MFAKWLDAAKIYADRRMPVMLAFGFSSGFPLLLVGSTLTVWLQESQIPYALIGLFSLTRMPYGFKWIWSPLIDRIRLPLFERSGAPPRLGIVHPVVHAGGYSRNVGSQSG